MKLPYLAFLLIASVSAAIGQAKPDDSIPQLQAPATYSMPQSAIDAEIEGLVTVAVRVDDKGMPTKAALIGGPMWPCGTSPVAALEELSSTLTDMMMKLQFAPARKNGKPVTKEVGFKLTLRNPKILPAVVIDPATRKPRATQISGGVLNGKAIELPKPVYPAEARTSRESGLVSVQIMIDEEGKVLRAGAVEGAPTLQLAAREAACNAKFSPMRLSGNLVKVSGVLTYNFVP